MFKNNKIKKILAFSVISSGVLFCGTNASAVKPPLNSGPPTNPLTVRKPVFSSERLLQRMKSGDPAALGPYIIVNKGGFLVDLDEVTGGDIRTLSSSLVTSLKEQYGNTRN